MSTYLCNLFNQNDPLLPKLTRVRVCISSVGAPTDYLVVINEYNITDRSLDTVINAIQDLVNYLKNYRFLNQEVTKSNQLEITMTFEFQEFDWGTSQSYTNLNIRADSFQEFLDVMEKWVQVNRK